MPMNHKAKLSLQDELEYSKSRLIELQAQSPTKRLAAAVDERLREFHRNKIAALTGELNNNAAKLNNNHSNLINKASCTRGSEKMTICTTGGAK